MLSDDLAPGGIEQVRAAHHVRHALGGIVDDDRELIRELSVRPPQHEIADIALEQLGLEYLHPIRKADFSLGPDPERARSLAWGQAGAAGAAIDAGAIDRQSGIGDFTARAAAGISVRLQSRKCIAIQFESAALVLDRAVPVQ